jgi:hypothetical protein
MKDKSSQKAKYPTFSVSSGNGESIALVNLALFIILLAFFLVMNSHADFKLEKFQQISDSLEKTFTTRIFQDNVAPSLVPDDMKSMREGFSLENLDQKFRADFPQLTARLSTSQGLYMIELTENQLDQLLLAQDQTDLGSKRDRFLSVLKLALSPETQKELGLELWAHPNTNKQRFIQSLMMLQNKVAEDSKQERKKFRLGLDETVPEKSVRILLRPVQFYEPRR